MNHLWKKIKYDPDKDYSADGEETDDYDVTPNLQNISDESFLAQASAQQSVGETRESTDDNVEENEEKLQSDDSEEDEEKEDGTVEGEITIPGLPKKLSKSQKKRLRRNKRKHATTPPEPNNSKVTKISTTSPKLIDGSSLVTQLIRKYSTSDISEDMKNEDSVNNTSSSLSSTPGSLSSEAPKPSELSSVVSSSGSVVLSGVN